MFDSEDFLEKSEIVRRSPLAPPTVYATILHEGKIL